MSIHIEVNENHANLLIDFYIERLRVLKDEITEREKESREISSQILRLKRGNKEDATTHNATKLDQGNNDQGRFPKYSDKWTWIKKIEFTITQKSKPLTTKEIVDALIEQEVGLMFERKKAIASVSSVLSTKSGEGKQFTRIETGSKDFAYTINHAFNKNDNSEEVLTILHDKGNDRFSF